MSFRDRSDAGQRLAAALLKYQRQPVTVLALPRGGVPVAKVAEALEAPLDLILVRKVSVPFQPELAMGAVVYGPTPIVVRNEDVISLTGISDKEFKAACRRELAEIERRRKAYLAGREVAPVAGRVAIVVDDGIATGATMRAALQAIRMRNPRRMVLAVPVAPTSTLQELRGDSDEIICLEDYADFGAIGLYYADFRQTSDSEVVALLARHPVRQTDHHVSVRS
jgi:predicted phosphoribosyltransferase